MTNPIFRYIKGLSGLTFYFLIALALFFTTAVLIFSIRSREQNELVMPVLTGKYYIDVHNDLARARLQVEIAPANYPDRNPGLILYQSIPAGSLVKTREKLRVVVNRPKPLVPMPDLVGSSLEAVRVAVGRIAFNEDIYSFEIGAITRVPENNVPPDTVLLQFPPAGENLSGDQKIYLLVSTRVRRKNQRSQKFELDEPGQNINVLSEYLIRQGLEYRINPVSQVPDQLRRTGLVSAIRLDEQGVYQLDVYYAEARARFRSGYEKIEFALKEQGECWAEQIYTRDAADAGPVREIIFHTNKHAPDEKITLIFYRRETCDIYINCGGANLYHKQFKPDHFG